MPEPNNVTPTHYVGHSTTPIDLIEAYGFGTGFNCGNAIKYIARHEEKNGKEDLVKAVWYLLNELKIDRTKIKEITDGLLS